MVALRLRLLGGFAAEIDGREVDGFRSNRVRALLAFLGAEANRSHRRDALAALLWTADDVRARTNLRISLADLRRQLGPVLEAPQPSLRIGRGDVVLLAPPARVDVLDLAAAATHVRLHQHEAMESCQPCHEELSDAAVLCAGPFLAGVQVSEAVALDDWRAVWSQRVEQDVMFVLSQLAVQLLAKGAHASAASLARRQLSLEPWAEEAHRTLMLALWMDGQRAAALAQFEACVTQLRDEIGVGPSQETLAVRDQITRSAPPRSHVAVRPAQTRRIRLPRDIGPFIGRAREVSEILAAVTEPSTPLVTVVGPGGIGKTRTAVTVARRLVDADERAFGDGIAFVDLTDASGSAAQVAAAQVAAGHEPGDPVEATALAIVDVLGMRVPVGVSAADQVLEHLAAKHALLLLDNVDALTATAVPTFIATLIDRAPDVTILATSRSRIDLFAEVVIHLDGLSVPHSSADVARFDSVALFTERATRGAPGFDLEADGEHVVSICQMVGGSPLALELAAARIGRVDCARIAGELADGISSLATARPDLPQRHRAMTAVFDTSWQHLSRLQQRVLLQLSAFRGSFALPAFQRIVDGDRAELAALTAASLVSRRPDGRSQLHAMITDYLLERHEADAQTLDISLTNVRRRHATTYLNLLALHGTRIGTRATKATLSELAPDRPNVLQAWAHATEAGMWTALRDGLRGLAGFLLLSGAWRDADHSLRAAHRRVQDTLAAAPGSTRTPTARVADTIGLLAAELAVERAVVANATGDSTLAVDLGRAVDAAPLPEGGDADAVRLAAAGQVIVGLTLLGRLDDAADQAGAAVRLIDRVHDSTAGPATGSTAWVRASGTVRRATAEVLQRHGDFDAARRAFTAAIDAFQQCADLRGEADALGGLGGLAKGMGDWTGARRHWTRQIDLYRLLGDRPSEGATEVNLGVVCYYAGDYLGAKNHYERALEICAEVGDRRNEGMARGNIGCVHRQLGDYDLARQMHEQALSVKHDIGYREGEAWGLTCLSLICHLQGQASAAREYRREALVLYESMRNTVGEGYGLTHRGHDLLEAGDVEGAMQAYRDAAARRAGVPHLLAESRAGLARAHLAAGDDDAARAEVEQVMAFLETGSLDGTEQPFRVALTCATVLRASDDPRAEPLVQAAAADLLRRADALAGEERERYLGDVTWRRELLALAGVAV